MRARARSLLSTSLRALRVRRQYHEEGISADREGTSRGFETPRLWAPRKVAPRLTKTGVHGLLQRCGILVSYASSKPHFHDNLSEVKLTDFYMSWSRHGFQDDRLSGVEELERILVNN